MALTLMFQQVTSMRLASVSADQGRLSLEVKFQENHRGEIGKQEVDIYFARAAEATAKALFNSLRDKNTSLDGEMKWALKDVTLESSDVELLRRILIAAPTEHFTPEDQARIDVLLNVLAGKPERIIFSEERKT